MMSTMTIDAASLQSVSDYTCDWPQNCSCYTEIFYDASTGKVFAREHTSEGDWSRFDDPAIHHVCGTRQHMSVNAIKARVQELIDFLAE